MEAGSVTIGHWNKAPIRIHWTAPLLAFFIGGFTFAPAIWFGFLLLILVHEIGHAVMIRFCGATAIAIALGGLGGHCEWFGEVTRCQRALIAWGGVWAQLLLYVCTYGVILIEGPPETYGGMQIYSVLTRLNLWIIALNLIPVEPFDGAQAWPLFSSVPRIFRRKMDKAVRAWLTISMHQRLKQLDKLEDNAQPNSELDKLLREVFAKAKDSDEPKRT